MSLAPIAFFAYNRPQHMRKALQSLSMNALAASSELYIFMDGPKDDKNLRATEEVRAVAASQKWCGTVHLVDRATNLGLSESIIQGVSWLCEKHGKVIVVEDDLIVSPVFLGYMNEALARYEDEPQVMQVAAYTFEIDTHDIEEDVFFLPLTTSWGWATWSRSWRQFDYDMTAYPKLEESEALRERFDLDLRYPYFNMAQQQRNGDIDSWAIRWYLSVFMANGLVLYPEQTLVFNGGMDGSGTHCGDRGCGNRLMRSKPIESWPEKIFVSPAFEAIKKAIHKEFVLQQPSSLLEKIRAKFRRIMRGV